MQLIPFDQQSALNMRVDCQVKLFKREIQLNYILQGEDLHNIFLPDRALRPERHDDLWLSTCFEFFLKLSDSKEYLEFNFSPSGDWNCYFFDDYRKGQNLIPFNDRPSTTLITNDNEIAFKVTTELPMPFTIGPHEINCSAVIKTEDDSLQYWALNHPHDKPDFHDREMFIPLPQQDD